MYRKIFAYPPYLVSIVFIWAFIFFLLNNATVFSDFDTPWHLFAGKEILFQRALILPNSWSFTAPDHFWWNISWLWDVVIYSIMHFLTANALYYFTAFFYALIIASLAYYLLLYKKLQVFEILFTVFFATLIMWDNATARPYAVTFLFVVWYLIIIKLYALNKNSGYLKYLPVMMIVWVNTHGGFIAGYMILLAALLEMFQQPVKKWDRKFFAYSVLTGICSLINPYEYGILTAVISTTHSKFTEAIDEWLPLAFGKGNFIFSIYLILFIISFNIRDKTVGFFEKFNSILWLVFALLHVRNIPLFMILSSAFFTSNIQNLSLLRKVDLNLKFDNKLAFGLCLSSICIVTLFFIFTPWKDNSPASAVQKPVVEFMMNKYPKLNFLNKYSLGGAIIYFSDGKQKVFVDGRAGTAYSDKVLLQYLHSGRDICTKGEQFLRQYNIKGLVALKNSNLHTVASKILKWREVYSDQYYIVYVANSYQ